MMKKNMGVETVCQTLEIAVMNSFEDLKHDCLEFIKANYMEVKAHFTNISNHTFIAITDFLYQQ